jgi:hypothetical protein
MYYQNYYKGLGDSVLWWAWSYNINELFIIQKIFHPDL